MTVLSALERPSSECPDSLIDWVDAARAGDEDAWNALVDRFLPLVTCVIAKYRLQACDAADVNQTMWLRPVEHLDDLREPRALPGWLATTARNESLQVIRRRCRDTPVDPQATPWERPDRRPELDTDLNREERDQRPAGNPQRQHRSDTRTPPGQVRTHRALRVLASPS